MERTVFSLLTETLIIKSQDNLFGTSWGMLGYVQRAGVFQSKSVNGT